jgi:hypothetical protein
MRCPKCGYISFDYNKFCPKCNKDISDEQTKLNLHTYKHNTPALLSMLVGAGDESSSGFTLDSTAALQRGGAVDNYSTDIIDQGMDFSDDDHELEISLSDDSELELPEVSLDDQSSDMDNLELEEDDVLALETDEEEIDTSADTGDDLSLDLGDLSMKGDKGFSTIELNVSDLKINDTGELEIDSISGDVSRTETSENNIMVPGNNDSQTIDINRTSHLELSDLTFDLENEPGITPEEATGTKKTAGPEEAGKDNSLDLGELALEDDDMISDEDNEGLDLDSLVFEDTDESESTSASMAETLNISSLNDNGTGSIELGDLAISEDDVATPKEDDDGIDLSDLTFDDEDIKNTGENIFAGAMDLDNQETGELNLENIDNKDTADDSQELDLSSFDTSNSGDSMDDLAIDLENLDLDLDLDNTEDKK